MPLFTPLRGLLLACVTLAGPAMAAEPLHLEVYNPGHDAIFPVSSVIVSGEHDAVLVDALYGGRTEQFIETQVKFEDGRTGSVSATLQIIDAKIHAPAKVGA